MIGARATHALALPAPASSEERPADAAAPAPAPRRPAKSFQRSDRSGRPWLLLDPEDVDRRPMMRIDPDPVPETLPVPHLARDQIAHLVLRSVVEPERRTV